MQKIESERAIALLRELAINLRWSWSHSADKIWEKLDPELFELTKNPWVLFQTVSQKKMEELFADPEYAKIVSDLVETNREEAQSEKWFQANHKSSSLTHVAYFSMEFMLTEGLPIYSGGLGNVAGDLLKAASDLGIPVVGVGLLYQRGYFRQVLSREGEQAALYPYNDPGQLPITPLRKENGEWLRLKIHLPGYSLWIRTWEVKVGNVKLYLLDSNDPANYPPHRAITSELYGGGLELRLQQEILLGIGGWRLLEALGIEPEVCHLNEGHAAFTILERAASFMKKRGSSFEVALTATRAGNLFTTHTAVPAGFDRFPPSLIERYLGSYAQKKLGITPYQLLALGRRDPDDRSEFFNMAYLAINGSGAVNAVSRLHQQVSKKLFQPLFPRWPEEEVPVGYVTNGVHMPCWDSEEADKLWTEHCGKRRWLGEVEALKCQIEAISDQKLFEMRNRARKTLIDYVRKKLLRQMEARGDSFEEVESARHLFDEDCLTIGFARRFATYKRPNMLLQNRERLLKILKNPHHPVQLIIAGKAHPQDREGQALIKEWIQFIKDPKVRPHVIFLSDYDLQMAEMLVQGVDVWLNTPRRPWEACGTSGMKVLVNGGLNLSELDGWWAEAYCEEVGWALGGGEEESDRWDDIEGEALLDILENQVIPTFYRRSGGNIPVEWTTKIRKSMALLTPQYSANRAVREYTEKYYLPAAANYCKRSGNGAEEGVKIVDWKRAIERRFPSITFDNLLATTEGDNHYFEVEINLDGIDPALVAIELFAEGHGSKTPERHEMERCSSSSKGLRLHLFKKELPATRKKEEYTPRIVPKFCEVAVPLEEKRILWQK